MALFLASYLQPWVASLIVAGVLVILVTLCACQGEKDNRIQDFGIPGRLSSITIDAVTQPIVDSCNGRPVSALTDTSAGSDGQTWTVTERALPDIPHAPQVQLLTCDTDTDQTPDSGSECYATVTKRENGCINNNRISTRESQVSSTQGLPVSSATICEDPCQDESQPSTSQYQYASEELQDPHPYAQVHKSTLQPFSSASESDDYDRPNINEEPRLSNLPASLSTAFSDNQNSPDGAEEPLLESGQKEIPYTVISVREPLEHVRMQTRQQQRQRQQVNQGSSADEPEGYYMEVPEQEQTYAEIYSGQNSTKSSATYDLIEPSNNPPDPPTVESLKFVAISHSRQASVVSESSFGSATTSAVPVVEGDNNNDRTLLSPDVDKTRNSTASVVGSTSETKECSDEIRSINLEDLYAKVHKKRVEGTMSVSGIEDVLSFDTDTEFTEDVFASARTSLSSSSTSRTPLPSLLSSSARLIGANRTLARRHSAEPTYSESNKKPLNDSVPCYASVTEKSKSREPEYARVNKNGEPSYAQVNRHKEESEPGYEIVRRTHKDSDCDPGYESIRRKNAECDAEVGYELVTGNSFRDGSDPGYECVKNLDQSSSDPGYEIIQKLRRNESDVVDPGYESVRRVKRETDRSDPDYECISFGQQTSDSEGYEKVGNLNCLVGGAQDAGYEHLPHSGNSKAEDFNNDGSEASGSIAETIAVHFSESNNENIICNGIDSVSHPSTSRFPPVFNDSFVCDKISLSVPYLGSPDVSVDTFLTVRVKSNSSENSVNFSSSIVEVECSPRSPTHNHSGPFNELSHEN